MAREHDVPRGWTALQFAEARVPPVGTVVQCVRSDCSDFCVPDGVPGLLPFAGDVVLPGMSLVVPDSWPQFAEARVPPVGTPVHCVESDCSDFCKADGNPELLGSICDTGIVYLLLSMWFCQGCARSCLQEWLLCRCVYLLLMGRCPDRFC